MNQPPNFSGSVLATAAADEFKWPIAVAVLVAMRNANVSLLWWVVALIVIVNAAVVAKLAQSGVPTSKQEWWMLFSLIAFSLLVVCATVWWGVEVPA